MVRQQVAITFRTFAMLLMLAGCAPGSVRQIEAMQRPTGTLKVVLMPMDVRISELTIGGMEEPNAAWTSQAERNIRLAVQDQIRDRAGSFVVSTPNLDDPERAKEQEQLVKLHEAVGATILGYRTGVLALPHKHGAFDWTLGPDVKVLQEQYGADYALFVYVRDSHSSSGRQATQIAVAILSLGRVYVPGGQQVGFASLVDLRTGNIAWFNVLARSFGDFRNPADAQDSVAALLSGLPS